MAWYPLEIGGAFSNTTLQGVYTTLYPYVYEKESIEEGEFPLDGMTTRMLRNITWAMGINLKVRLTTNGSYGSFGPNGELVGGYADIGSEVQALFLEASNFSISSLSNSLTFSSKISFGSFLTGVFLISSAIQTTIKSSYMALVETERIRNTEYLKDRPELVPYMPPEASLYLEGFGIPHWSEISAQHEAHAPHSVTLLSEIYKPETMRRVSQRSGAIFYDYTPFVIDLHKICPAIKGFYIYISPEPLATVYMTWYYRRNINKTLVREIDKRVRWLDESDVPWVTRFNGDGSNSPCFVEPMKGGSVEVRDNQTIGLQDVAWIFETLVSLWILTGTVFLIEIANSKISPRMRPIRATRR